jgi:endonuclease/exonuclease/phosphatase family metal-dependent hydrolase
VPLKVLTLNLWNDSGAWPERAKRIREWIDRLEPDLIAFQEALRLAQGDQVQALLDGRGYHLDWVRASAFWKRGREADAGCIGNAVASRFPIASREELRLPGSGDGETRAALSLTLRAPLGPVSFTVTHLNWKLDHGHVRERQVVALCDLALRRRPVGGFPPILAGDFNAEPDAAEIRYVTGLQSLAGRSVVFLDAWRMAGDGGPGFTWSNRNPHARRELDERDGVWPSDHFGVYAELRSEPLPEGERRG